MRYLVYLWLSQEILSSAYMQEAVCGAFTTNHEAWYFFSPKIAFLSIDLHWGIKLKKGWNISTIIRILVRCRVRVYGNTRSYARSAATLITKCTVLSGVDRFQVISSSKHIRTSSCGHIIASLVIVSTSFGNSFAISSTRLIP